MDREHFDYVIIGAGSAGCVLTDRLSQGGARVLLLEAGGSDFNPLISIPIGMGKLHQYKLYDWRETSEPEPNLMGRRMQVARGKVLGGSSSINIMAYTRGNPRDYDRWADNGARGWSYAEVLPYFRSCETWQDGADPWRGGDGPLGTQWAKTVDPIYQSWIEAGKSLGHPATPDYNGARPEGFGRGQYTIRDGRRSSTARAFLAPARRRRNVVVATRAFATKILIERGRAVGVAYMQGGRARTAYADREVIVSAGAINTPHLLMLSGIGDAAHLKASGVTPLVDLPVGKNLQDHLGISINWRRLSPGPFRDAMRLDRLAVSMALAYFTGTGAATVVPGGLHAFIRSAPAVAYADIEFMFHTVPAGAGLWFPGIAPAYDDGYGIRPALMRPQSRGDVTLRSADPRERPIIRFNALSAPKDLTVLREGYKRALEVGEAHAMRPYRGVRVDPDQDLNTDAAIDDYIRRTAITMLHPVGTCKMGGDDSAVVNPDLTVRGVGGLRVVDGSVMPDLVSAHINAAIIMIAEKASHMILGRDAATPMLIDVAPKGLRDSAPH